jgi:hypothetical protein
MHLAIRMELTGRFPGGRPPRIPDWLRRAFVEEAEKELAGFDLETFLATELPFEDMSNAGKLAHLERLGTAMLLDPLRQAVGDKNRNRSAIAVARDLAGARRMRVKQGARQRNRLDELIEAVAMR